MTETCRYFDSDEWDERLKRHVGRVWDVQDLVRKYKSENVDVSEITGNDTEHIFELGMDDVVAIWREAEQALDNISEECSHDVKKYGLCIFHLPVEEKDDEETREELLRKIQQSGKGNKEFVGAKFGELNLAHEILKSDDDNHPIDLRLAEVEELDMQSATVHQRWESSRSLVGDGEFFSAEFRGVSSFRSVEFKRKSNFSDADFKSDSYFINAKFGNGSLFNHVRFEGKSHFGGVEIEGSSYFADARFREESNFGRAVFRGRSHFAGADFGGDSDFRHADFEEKSNFSRAVFRGGSYFRRAEFRGVSEFEGARFEGKSDFSWVDFRGTCKFNGVEFGGVTYFGSAYFEWISVFKVAYFGGETYFDSARFDGSSDFRETEFVDSAFFRGAEFREAAYFNNVEFRRVSIFNDAEFDEDVSFDESVLNNMNFEETVASRYVINLKNSTMNEGCIRQPEDSSTFYDLQDATVGEIDIHKENSDHDLFDYFRFYKTDFDGFDFTDYKDELGSKPEIHEFGHNSDDEQEETPAGLEATYLKAKDGAKKVGDHELASEFFIKEMQYRREKYKDEIESEDLGWKRRAKLEFDRRVNWLYEMTSGYGEKPIRVILTSLSVVVLFTFLYPFWGIRQTGDGTARTLSYASASAPAEYLDVIAHSSYFSSVTFTTLGYGDLHPVGFSRILSMVQSATGALLIALLIFVFGRSVKW